MEKRPKILMSAYAVDNNDIGEAHLSFHWINNLAKQADITLITMGSRIHSTCGLENTPRVKLVIAKPVIRFRWTGAFDRIFKPDYFEFFLRARRAAKRLIQVEKYDACHHIAPHSPRYPSPLYGLGIRFFIGPVHGGLDLPREFRRNGAREVLSSALRKLDKLRNKYDPVLQKHFRSAEKILISAPYVAKCIPEEFREKCVIIPPQPPEVLPAESVKRAKSKTLRLIFVGRLIGSKGIELAIQALGQTKSSNISLTVYGTGVLEAELKSLVTDLNLVGRVHFKGFVRHEDILKAYYNTDVLIFPSLKEAWGLAVAEAMGAGLAVICVDRGGPGYMVDQSGGIKISIASREKIICDLAEAIDFLTNNRKICRSMGKLGKKKIDDQFTWEAVIRHIIGLYIV